MSNETVIRGTRSWPLIVLVTSMVGLIAAASGPAFEIMPKAIFVASTLLLAAMLLWAVAVIVKPNRLVLGDEGFVIEPSLAKPHAITWRDVETVPAQGAARTAWLSWSPRAGAALPRLLTQNSADGRTARFPGGWVLPADEIAALMNARLEASRS